MHDLTSLATHPDLNWSTVKTLERGDFLAYEGQVNTDLYYIDSGCIRVYEVAHGEEQNIRFGYAQEVITALDSYLTNQPSKMCLQAIRRTKIKKIPKDLFVDWINQAEERKDVWITVLESLNYQQIQRERDLLTTSPIDRLSRVLHRSPRLFQEVPLKHIANYLRMSPETLSRSMKQLR